MMRWLIIVSLSTIVGCARGPGLEASAPTESPAESEKGTAVEQGPPTTEPDFSDRDASSVSVESVFVLAKTQDAAGFVRGLEKMKGELKSAGLSSYLVARDQNEEQRLIVHLLGTSDAKLEKFASRLEEKKEAGSPFASATDIFVVEDNGYQLPDPWPKDTTYSVFFLFRTDDFHAWRSAFDKNEAIRKEVGVLGYGIHSSLTDDRVLVHYITRSVGLIKQILEMPEVKELEEGTGLRDVNVYYGTNIANARLID